MSGLVLVDVALSIVFTILVVSIIASALVEAVASLLQWRAAGLQRGLRSLMGGGVADFMDRAVIEGLSVGAGSGEGRVSRKPSAMSPAIFAKEALNWLGVTLDGTRTQSVREQLKIIEAQFDGSPNPVDRGKAALAEKIHAILNGVEEDAAAIEKAVAAWFDDSIQRVGGWYRRRTRTFLFWIGLAFAALLNINLVQYAGDLIEDDARREAAAAQAVAAAQTETLGAFSDQIISSTNFSPDQIDGVETLQAQVRALREEVEAASTMLADSGSGMGWDLDVWPQTGSFGAQLTAWLFAQGDGWFWLTGVFSWVSMGFAVTLGAQFWFDLLKSLVKLRTAGPASAPKQADQDSSA